MVEDNQADGSINEDKSISEQYENMTFDQLLDVLRQGTLNTVEALQKLYWNLRAQGVSDMEAVNICDYHRQMYNRSLEEALDEAEAKERNNNDREH